MTSRFWASGGSALTLARGFRLDASGAGAGALINAPTYALSTASGVSPTSWNVTGDSTFQPGMYVHQQFAVSGTSFATPVPGAPSVDYYTQVQGSDWEAASSTIGNGLVTFVQPTGTYDTRCRFETVPGDSTNNVVSGWSNTVTDTIVSTTTVLDGTKRNTNNATIGTSASFGANLKLTGVDQSAPQSAGTTNQVPVGGKYYNEVTITALSTHPGYVALGIADGTFVWATSFTTAANQSKGAGLDVNGFIYPSTAHSISAEAATNVLQMCVKRTSSTAVIVWIGKNNTWANGDPSAETGGDSFTLNDTNCWGYVSVNNSVDQADCNFGQSAFTYTKPTGATAWS